MKTVSLRILWETPANNLKSEQMQIRLSQIFYWWKAKINETLLMWQKPPHPTPPHPIPNTAHFLPPFISASIPPSCQVRPMDSSERGFQETREEVGVLELNPGPLVPLSILPQAPWAEPSLGQELAKFVQNKRRNLRLGKKSSSPTMCQLEEHTANVLLRNGSVTHDLHFWTMEILRLIT